MTAIPTRWRTAVEDQLSDAEQRLERAERHIADDDGSRAMQEAYPAVVAAATIRVWQRQPPWQRPLIAEDMQRLVREALPSLFAALAEMNVPEVLTSAWRAQDAQPYVAEARRFLRATREQSQSWLAQG